MAERPKTRCEACGGFPRLYADERHVIAVSLLVGPSVSGTGSNSKPILPVSGYGGNCGVCVDDEDGAALNRGFISMAADFFAEQVYVKFSPIKTAEASAERMRADVHAMKSRLRLQLEQSASARIVFDGSLAELPQALDVWFVACSQVRGNIRVLGDFSMSYAWRATIVLRGWRRFRPDLVFGDAEREVVSACALKDVTRG